MPSIALISKILWIMVISIGFSESFSACYPGVTPALRVMESGTMEGLPNGAKSHYEAHD
jgi:hypothetical protein